MIGKKLWQSLGSARIEIPIEILRNGRRTGVLILSPAPHAFSVLVGRNQRRITESLDCAPYRVTSMLPITRKAYAEVRDGGILAVKNVLNRTYKATSTVHSHRLPGSESKCESMIGTTVITMTGTITRAAPTGATWRHSTEVS